MKAIDLFTSSWQSLERTRGRSALTMLGIIIGILSVILVLSIGEAAQRYIVGQIASFGSDLVVILNGPKQAGAELTAFTHETLTFEDTKALQQESWVKTIIGSVEQQDTVSGNGVDVNAKVTGTMPDEVVFYNLTPKEGVFLTMDDVNARSRVVVLGAEIADDLFGQDSALGKNVKINRQNFRVIGVMPVSGTRGFDNLDKNAYVPVTAAMDLYNQKYVQGISFTSELVMTDAISRATDLLRNRHKIDIGEDDDFNIQTSDDLIKTVSQITDILKILLSSIAAISLIVGGIGIMNIMYVSVTERTREIGLRKAIGAKSSDVLRQFLAESVMLTTLGGAVGIALGILVTWLAISLINRFQSGWGFGVSLSGIELGLGVSMAIGIIFGYAPARRAANLNPIDALRRE
ncbi:MAG TPA: ABC transporter permease [Verrucomicrobiae bacterium]|nr:ABC transporter permease [Verrucomicrobiae bacterium]